MSCQTFVLLGLFILALRSVCSRSPPSHSAPFVHLFFAHLSIHPGPFVCNDFFLVLSWSLCLPDFPPDLLPCVLLIITLLSPPAFSFASPALSYALLFGPSSFIRSPSSCSSPGPSFLLLVYIFLLPTLSVPPGPLIQVLPFVHAVLSPGRRACRCCFHPVAAFSAPFHSHVCTLWKGLGSGRKSVVVGIFTCFSHEWLPRSINRSDTHRLSRVNLV